MATADADSPLAVYNLMADFTGYIKSKIWEKWQISWNQADNHLHTIQAIVRKKILLPNDCKSQVVISRLRLGHTSLTHSWLLDKKTRPTCSFCQREAATVPHLLRDCPALVEQRDPDQVEEFMENHYNSESGDSEIFIVTYDNEEGKPTEQDHEATLLLLNLREKYAAKFDDRKTTADQRPVKSVDNAQLIEILKTESNERKDQFDIITNLLQEQNHQRDRMLTLLEGLGGQKRKRPSRMSYLNNQFQDPNDIVNAFADFFQQCYTASGVFTDRDVIHSDTNNVNTPFISESDVTSALKKLKPKLTAGPDNIPAFLLKDCASVLAYPLQLVFNLALKTCKFPEIWKLSSISPIFKKGNRTQFITKLRDFYCASLAENYDVLAITETWLSSDVYNNEILDARYSIYRNDRNALNSIKGRGGGVMLAVSSKYESLQLTNVNKEVEEIWVKIITGKRDLILCCVYLLPKSDLSKFSSHIVSLQNICNNHPDSDIIVLGDFNLPNIEWTRQEDLSGLVPCNVTAKNEILDCDSYFSLCFSVHSAFPVVENGGGGGYLLK
ncbi:hypothetical protein GEV33_006731 [Tenebrio molitor]|uniref:Endonuclease/exonuclease/phosphatase domain-containing protein n=1 Tax=Tenebrio molitor TaxID=7067 RepID=A0A8J6HK30_TENMO|nr:hypothetical protein GEV33_006731 [Tenebrio molitor]